MTSPSASSCASCEESGLSPIPPLGALIVEAGRHLCVLGPGGELAQLQAVATAAGIDIRDLECTLVRLALPHHRRFAGILALGEPEHKG